MRVGVGVNSQSLPTPRLPGPEPRPLCWPRPNLPHPSLAPSHPDSFLGSLTATRHHSAGSPHAAEATQVGGARDRHRGDGKVLRGPRESIQGRGKGERIPSNTGCSQPLPPQRGPPRSLRPPSALCSPHPRLVPLLTRNVSATISAPR